MEKQTTNIPGLILFTPKVFPDERGRFLESYNRKTLEELGLKEEFVQDSLSVNKQGVLRGLHFQKEPFSQAKLVSVIEGEVFDVAVDLRKDSETYGKWFGTILSGEKHNMMYIPKGFAHGFYVLSEKAIFFYKISGGYYSKEASSGIIWNDPKLNISWPLNGNQPIVSAQDRNLPAFG